MADDRDAGEEVSTPSQTTRANRILAVAAVTSSFSPLVYPQTPMPTTCCPILELRQYTLHPGKRDVLIELFDREFVESQEALGMNIAGQFRDAGNPDRFVWMRGFRDMPARGVALNSFYSGPVWQTHRNTANATMIDASNVLLLRPISPNAGFAKSGAARAAVGTSALPASRVMATIYALNAPVDVNFIQFFEQQVKPLLIATGATPIAVFQTETAENNFPRLPIRTGEHVLVWFSRFASEEQVRAHEVQIGKSAAWNNPVEPTLRNYLKSPAERLVLEPTARSLLR